ncbi:MAG: hypothetical protein K1X86_01325 [Ignavibacteria bacterium]|nr:hypothetical protein [Ignavibacteria bacterium]
MNLHKNLIKFLLRKLLIFSLIVIFIALFFNISFSQTLNDYKAIASGNWGTAANWQRYNGSSWVAAGTSPSNTSETVTISFGTTITLDVNLSLDQLVINGTLSLNAGDSLNIVNGSGTDLTLSGIINGAGNIFVNSGALVDMQSGTLTGAGIMTVSSGGTFSISNSTVTIDRVLNNNGTVNWNSGTISGSGTFNNNNIFNNQTVFGSSFNNAFNNYSTFTKNSNNQNIFFGVFNNTGTVNIQQGNITLGIQSGTHSIGGAFNVSSGAILQLGQNSFTNFNVSASVAGAGTIVCYTTAAVNFLSSCIYNVTGTTTAQLGTMNFNAGMTLTNAGNISPAGGTIVFPAGLTVNGYGSSLNITAGGTFSANCGKTFSFQKVFVLGYINGSDSIIVTDSLSLSSGSLTGNGAITLNSGGVAAIFNNGCTFDKSFFNNGTVNWTASSIFGSGVVYNNSVINISGTALTCYPQIINQNTINKSSNTASVFPGGFTNGSSAVINITAGSIMSSANTNTYSIAGTVIIASGTYLQLGNSSTATYNVSGTIAGAGSFYCHTANVNLNSGCNYNITGTTGTYSGNMNFNSVVTLTNIGTITSVNGTLNLQPGLLVPAYGTSLSATGGAVINFNTGQKFQFASINLNGTIAGSDTIVLSGNMTFSGATLSGSGPFNMLSGSVMDIVNNAVTVNKTINNSGTINWMQTGINGSGVINNNNVFNISTNANYGCYPLVNNNSVINKGTNSSPVLLGGCNNSGTVNVTSGSLIITPTTGTFTSSGTFNVSASCGLTMGQVSGTASHNVNGTVAGAGSVTLSAQTVTFGAASVYNVSGSTIASLGTVNLNSAMTLTNMGNLTVSGATVNFPAGLTIGAIGSTLTFSSGTINFNTGRSKTFNQIDLGGTFAGTDTVFVNTTLNWNANGFNNTGVLKSGGTAIINNNTVNVSGTFINNGTVNWTILQISGAGSFYNNNIFNINTTSAYTLSPNLINNGTINKNTANINAFAGTFTNNGFLNINSGGISAGNGTNLNPASITLSNNTTFAVNNGTFVTTGLMTIPPNSFINGNGVFTYNAANLVNDGTISVTTFQFDSVTNISGSGALNVVNCNFLNGCVCTLTSNHQFKNININSGGSFNLNGLKASFNGTGTTIITNGTFNTNNSTIEYNASSQQTISTANISYKNLLINNTAGCILTNLLNVNDTLNVQTGFLNLNQNNIVLSSVGFLRENPGCTVRGVNGTISTTRNLDSLSAVDVAGLGAAITTSKVLGAATISRGHGTYTINGSSSVSRYYNISTANNTNLNATLKFHYDNSELNGLNENLTALFRSTNAGANWFIAGGTKDTANNNITLQGVNSFSYWTVGSNPLAVSVNFTAIIDGLYNTGTGMLNKKDTVTAYLRNSFAPYSIIDSAKFLIDSVIFSGLAYFNNTPSGTYYYSLKYKNSIETWSKAGGETYTAGSSMSYDFTSAQSQSYGNSTVLKNGKYCMVSGDINQDGFVNGNDFTAFSQQFGQTGVLTADLNGDNVVNGNDFTTFSASFGKQSSHP